MKLETGGLFFLLCVIGCIQEFDPGNLQLTKKLVVDGQLDNSKGIQSLYLTLSKAVNDPSSGDENVLDATAWITDNLNVRYDYKYIKGGTYQIDSTVLQPTVGNIYTLHIQWRGKEYASKPQQFPFNPGIDSVYAKFVEKKDDDGIANRYFELFVTTHDPPGISNYYTWNWKHFELTDFCQERLERNASGLFLYRQKCCSPISCWNVDPCFDCEEVVSDAFFNGNVLTRKIGIIPYDSKEPYFVVVDQIGISKETYAFLKAATNQLNNSGGIFDQPPQTIDGNIFNINDPTDQVLGLFRMTGLNKYAAFIPRDYINLPVLPAGQYPIGTQIVDINSRCIECGESTYRTARKPFGWK